MPVSPITMPMTILVTGGCGFLGQHLVPKLLERYPGACIRTLSRGGNAIQLLTAVCSDRRLTPIVGDIRNRGDVEYALQKVDIVVHLAALKHIDLCELYPREAIEININGTKNLLDAFSGNTFIAMSTDKASEVTSCYGATKLLMEKLVLEQAELHKDRRYMVVRSGNLFGSTGSVIEKWRQQIQRCNRIDITSPTMTRFFVSAATVAEHISSLTAVGKTGCISIPRQGAIRLSDLAGAVVALWGNSETTLRVVGARYGEKEHESLYTDGEKAVTELACRLSCDAPLWTPEEIARELENLE